MRVQVRLDLSDRREVRRHMLGEAERSTVQYAGLLQIHGRVQTKLPALTVPG